MEFVGGGAGGIVGGVTGYIVGAVLFSAASEGSGMAVVPYLGTGTGCAVGSALAIYGVGTMTKQEGRFNETLVGTMLGSVIGGLIALRIDNPAPLIIFSVVGGVM